MTLARTLVALPQVLAAVLFFAPPAEARTVDRVVAVAGSHVFLLSEVRARARVDKKGLRETCEHMIDDALVRDEADSIRLTVSEPEIDAAIDSIARDNGLTREGVRLAVLREGMSEAEYRESLRTQLLRLRLMSLRKADPKKYDANVAALAAELRAKVWVEDRLAP